jgi:hypothetical protein
MGVFDAGVGVGVVADGEDLSANALSPIVRVADSPNRRRVLLIYGFDSSRHVTRGWCKSEDGNGAVRRGAVNAEQAGCLQGLNQV